VPDSQPVIAVRNLRKQFDALVAVDDVTLDVQEGHIHSIIGPNGAGKTTFFNLLTKIHQPTSGSVLYRGEDITALSPAQTARRGIGRSFQISAVFPTLTALQNVLVALQARKGDALQFWRSPETLAPMHDEARRLLGLVELERFAETPVAAMSYGRKRALEIATTLALEPKVLLLDEPMSGMGREDIAHVSELLRRIVVGRTIIMIEHNLSVVSTLSDHITVFSRGRIIASGTYAEVSSNPGVVEAYIGEGHD
jgi:branched-chain amino acid transport system ATP-binding protein